MKSREEINNELIDATFEVAVRICEREEGYQEGDAPWGRPSRATIRTLVREERENIYRRAATPPEGT